ncbi:MAG: hypothetical protein ACLTG0_01195 [Oscillibacter sp.]
MGAEQLRLNHTELSIYAHRCGTELSDAQIEIAALFERGVVLRHLPESRARCYERGELPSRQLGYLRDVLPPR